MFRTLYGSQFACANAATGGCTNNQVIGQFFQSLARYAGRGKAAELAGLLRANHVHDRRTAVAAGAGPRTAEDL